MPNPGQVLALGFVLSAWLPAATAQQSGEWWEVKQKVSMDGMSMPAMTNKICKPVDSPAEDLVPAGDDGNCTTSNLRKRGAKVSFDMACTGPDAMTGSGEIEQLGPDAYRGRSVMNSDDGEVQVEFEGRKVGGACDPQAPMKKAQAMATRGQVDACRGMGEKMAPPGPLPGALASIDMGCRTTHKAAYCEGVRNGRAAMTERDRFVSITHAAPEWREAFKFCGQDPLALERQVCEAAAKDKEYHFVADHCPVVAREIAARCSGRDITSLSKSGQVDLLPICRRYGPGAGPDAATSDAGAAPAAGSEAEQSANGPPAVPEKKPTALDKLKKGGKGLKDLIRLP